MEISGKATERILQRAGSAIPEPVQSSTSAYNQNSSLNSSNAGISEKKPTLNTSNQNSSFNNSGNSFNSEFKQFSNTGSFNNMKISKSNSGNEPATLPIASINPYQNRWTIKARVSGKSDIKTWSNQKGTGRLFNGEIRATGFNDQIDQFYSMLEIGKVYYLSSARVNMANPKFNHVKNEYELVLESFSELSMCDVNADVPEITYNFTKISKLMDNEKDSVIDVLGVVIQVGELSEIRSKATNRAMTKRDLTIVDDTMYSVRLTLWGPQAENYGINDNPVIAFTKVRVGDFGGRTLSALSSSSIIPNPDIPEAYRLRSWYDKEGSTAKFNSFDSGMSSGNINVSNDQIKTISQIKDEGLGLGEKPDYYVLDATIVYIRQENIAYPACPSDNCSKKIFQEGDEWRCENCQKSYPKPEYRYIFSVNVSDHTGNMWLQCFNESGNELLGIKADDIMPIYENNKEDFDAIVAKANFLKFRFRCRAKNEVYNDVSRINNSVMTLKTIDYVADCDRLFDLISQY
ncbi:Replication factor A protein 1 [Smittium culicis]|uniref:Replication protein A subunit n=1 Tax=Smittium culicis TaxID=133412 RepID=A0A1R1X8Q2_9FUNG|nr:Replication factor A protein 1 [Smittium culicis]OMJ19831.1 Replication factor A protein 1 [Smittium culicis]